MSSVSKLTDWLQKEVYPGYGSTFYRHQVLPLADIEKGAEGAERFVQEWFCNTAYPRAMKRRVAAIWVEHEVSGTLESWDWAFDEMQSNQPLEKSKAEEEVLLFNDYLFAEIRGLTELLEETFPGFPEYPWNKPHEVLGQLAGKFPKYRRNLVCREFFSETGYIPENERERYEKLLKSPEKRGKTIENLKPWLMINEPIFRHYAFPCREILRCAVLQCGYGSPENPELPDGKHFQDKFEQSGDPKGFLLGADVEFEDYLAANEVRFRKVLERLKMTRFRSKARPDKELAPYFPLVLRVEFDPGGSFGEQ